MKKIFTFILPLLLASSAALAQERISDADTSLKEQERNWFANVYAGYSIRTAKAGAAIANTDEFRHGLKLGADIQHRFAKCHNISLGVMFEYTFSQLTRNVIDVAGNSYAQSTVHTIYAGPVLTFMQPVGKGELYEDISLGYVKYIENIYQIYGSRLDKRLLARSEALGYKISLGYHLGCWDFKCAFFNSSLSTFLFAQKKQHIGKGEVYPPMSLAAMSFTVGFHF